MFIYKVVLYRQDGLDIAITGDHEACMDWMWKNRCDPKLAANYIGWALKQEQVIDWIAERAKSTELSLSFSDAMQPTA